MDGHRKPFFWVNPLVSVQGFQQFVLVLRSTLRRVPFLEESGLSQALNYLLLPEGHRNAYIV